MASVESTSHDAGSSGHGSASIPVLTDVSFTDCSNSKYIRPRRMHFKLNGHARVWDLIQAHDSVSILVYHKQRDAIIMVKQFRPAVWHSYMRSASEGSELKMEDEASDGRKRKRASDGGDSANGEAGDQGAAHDEPKRLKGFTYELCAGLVDKRGKSLQEIAKEEVLEECGYDVSVDSLVKITSFRNSVGIEGSKMTCFYVEVDDSMKVSDGGGNPHEGEMIEVIEWPVSQIREFVTDESVDKASSLGFAILWFLERRQKTGASD